MKILGALTGVVQLTLYVSGYLTLTAVCATLMVAICCYSFYSQKR